jgi:hypothetical protein
MEQTEVKGQSADQPDTEISDAPLNTPSPARRTGTILSQQAGTGTCATCGAAAEGNPNGGEMTYGYVFAMGSIRARFPSPAVEKEFAQTIGRADTAGLTDAAVLRTSLSERRNRYLARQVCYVLNIEGTEAYILTPRDPSDVELLVDAIRPAPSPLDVDIVIGVRGPIAPPEMCNGLMVPMVVFEQIFSFDRDALFAAIRPPEGAPPEQAEVLRAAAQDLFDRIMRLADNLGATDEHRAVNFLAARSERIYQHTAQMFVNNFSLTSVYAIPSRLSGTRRLVNVNFTYTHRQTGEIQRYRIRVDVTEMFPFLHTTLEPYYDIER